jgi:hypothetical protein
MVAQRPRSCKNLASSAILLFCGVQHFQVMRVLHDAENVPEGVGDGGGDEPFAAMATARSRRGADGHHGSARHACAMGSARRVGLSGVFMALTFVVFVGYGLFAAAIRTHVVSRPRILTWMRRSFAGAFVLLGARLALTER